jgi:peptidase M28-like protein
VRYRNLALCLFFASGALAAQTPASIREGIRSITPADVRRRIGILADDSMMGRATPSPELEETARYVANQFRQFGLRPGGDGGSYLQRYPIERLELVPDGSLVVLSGAVEASWGVGSDIQLVFGTPLDTIVAPAVILVGSVTSGSVIDSAAIAGKVVFIPIEPQRTRLTAQLRHFHAAAVICIAEVSDSAWAALTALQAREIERNPGAPPPRPPVFLTRDRAARSALTELGVSLDSARNPARQLLVRPLAGVRVRIAMRARALERHSAPNVIGILEGRDPELKGEYVFFTAHMDHIGTPGSGEGCRAQGGDSICNGADDDASGTTAVIEAAQAFAQLSSHPRRSLVFMTVSGEERGLWGSQYFSEHPAVPLAQIVADVNIDMVGRNWKDTIVVIGKEQSDLGATLNRVAAGHPELHMTPIGDLWPQENFYFRSDHYNFARNGVPILFFFNGTHPDYHQVTDSPDKIDGEKESRIIKLVCYLGLEIANTTARPRWNPASYRRIVIGARAGQEP